MDIGGPTANLETEAASDPKARKEFKDYVRLDEIEAAKHAVRMAVHKALAWLIPITVGFAFILFWMGIAVYAFHMMTPWGWLTEDQLKDIKTVLFSGVLGAIVSQAIKRYLE